MNYLSPKRLRRGDRVAIIAPAAQVRSDELLQGLDLIKQVGLKPVLGPSVRKLSSEGIYDAPLKDRIDELMWAFKSPDIHAIFCALGGFGSAELLPYLDYDVIRRSQKIFIGKSDITALNCGIMKEAGLINFNGKTAMIRKTTTGFLDSDYESLELACNLMMSDQPWAGRPFQINQFVPRTICPGKVSGIAIGGNLETLTCLLGTPYMPDLRGAVLFLEDVHKSGINIARSLLHLKMAGVLNDVAGVVVGEFADVPDSVKSHSDILISDALQEFLSEIPSVYGYSFSHGSHIATIPIGAPVMMDAQTGEIIFDFIMES